MITSANTIHKTVAESIVITFNFSALLAAGETILSVAGIVLTAIAGVDSNSSTVLSGVAAISSDSLSVMQRVTNGLQNCMYKIQVKVNTDLTHNNLLEMCGFLNIVD